MRVCVILGAKLLVEIIVDTLKNADGLARVLGNLKRDDTRSKLEREG